MSAPTVTEIRVHRVINHYQGDCATIKDTLDDWPCYSCPGVPTRGTFWQLPTAREPVRLLREDLHVRRQLPQDRLVRLRGVRPDSRRRAQLPLTAVPHFRHSAPQPGFEQ